MKNNTSLSLLAAAILAGVFIAALSAVHAAPGLVTLTEAPTVASATN